MPTGFQTAISAKEGTINLTLHWSESFTTAYNIEIYCVRSLEVGTSCYGRQCISSTSSYHCDGLRPGQYGFRVQAINCGDQLGEESETVTVHPQCKCNTVQYACTFLQ